ncbi:probable G-protein coupled receptor No9 [Exaiptasia diaphana]|uniref:G-protein coupled receptors family 1 profile domain-containing protein n=1 Tax=Exaiptasia diaphana TaxID=2652724 RepID=A0A913XU75_EXADI|nr:probable G-protein coupled receptor No9 [Exaiptasia diaphana]
MNTSSSQNETVTNEPRSTIEVTLLVSLYVGLSLTVITGNSLIIASYTINAKLRKGITVFFVSLAISDLCVGLVPIPYWITVLLYPSIRTSWNRILSVFDIFGALASIFNLVAISIERRVVLSANSKMLFPHGRLKRLNVTMICIAWFVALVISVCWLVLKETVARALVVFLGGFAIPLVVLVMIYFDIYRRVKETQERFPRHGTKEEGKTAYTVFIITALFVIAWMPFFVCSIISTFKESLLPIGQNQRRLVDFVKWMHYSNSAVNPFVYAYRNDVMHQTMLSIFHRIANTVLCSGPSKQKDVLLQMI